MILSLTTRKVSDDLVVVPGNVFLPILIPSMDTAKRKAPPIPFVFYCSATHVTSQVLQPKTVNKRYRGSYTFSSVHWWQEGGTYSIIFLNGVFESKSTYSKSLHIWSVGWAKRKMNTSKSIYKLNINKNTINFRLNFSSRCCCCCETTDAAARLRLIEETSPSVSFYSFLTRVGTFMTRAAASSTL